MKNILKVLIVLILLTHVSVANAMGDSRQLNAMRKITPQLKVKTLDGKMFDLQKTAQNKLTMVVFWAYWCGICKAELRMLNSLYDKYREQNFEIIGVSIDDVSKINKIMAIAKDLKFKNAIYDKAEIINFTKSTSIPESYLINHEGQVIKIFKGQNDREDLEEIILKHLPTKLTN